MDSFNFLNDQYLNNPIQDYLIAFGAIVVGLLFLRLFRTVVLSRLKKKAEATETPVDDIVIHGIERFLLPVAGFTIVYFAINYLTLSDRLSQIVNNAAVAVLTFYAARIVTRTIRLTLHSQIKKQPGGEEKIKQMRGIIVVVNVIVWATGLIFLFDNLGYNVTAIVTGLGIGGIAIALAAQNILGDLFNYFVIFFDRPFEIGDLIKIDDKSGTVEYIGVKTTRLRSVNGEQLIFSNSDLTKSRLHNYKKMQARRVIFTLRVHYQTAIEKVKLIPARIEKVIKSHPNVLFERVHLASLGEFSLNFEIVYHVDGDDYQNYMDAQHSVNVKILEEFSSMDIQLAYPTQTLHLNKL